MKNILDFNLTCFILNFTSSLTHKERYKNSFRLNSVLDKSNCLNTERHKDKTDIQNGFENKTKLI